MIPSSSSKKKRHQDEPPHNEELDDDERRYRYDAMTPTPSRHRITSRGSSSSSSPNTTTTPPSGGSGRSSRRRDIKSAAVAADAALSPIRLFSSSASSLLSSSPPPPPSPTSRGVGGSISPDRGGGGERGKERRQPRAGVPLLPKTTMTCRGVVAVSSTWVLRFAVAMATLALIALQLPVLVQVQVQRNHHHHHHDPNAKRPRPSTVNRNDAGTAVASERDDDAWTTTSKATTTNSAIDYHHLQASLLRIDAVASDVNEPTSRMTTTSTGADPVIGVNRRRHPDAIAALQRAMVNVAAAPAVAAAGRPISTATMSATTSAATKFVAAAQLTSNDHANPRQRPRKPRMYLHVGPYKTGTTFLQCALSRNLYEYLQSDHLLYLGTCAHECKRKVVKDVYDRPLVPFVVPGQDEAVAINATTTSQATATPPPSQPYEFCVGHAGDSLFSNKNHSLFGPLQNKLRSMAQSEPPTSRRDAMIVWEYLSDLYPERLDNLLRELSLGGWEIHVIVHYRRLYEWLPSLHAQLLKPGWNGRPHFMVWPDDKVYRPLQQQKGMGLGIMARHPLGKVRPPFRYYPPPEAWERDKESGLRYRTIVDVIHRTGTHPAEAAVTMWLPHAAAVHVVDLHQLKEQSRRSRSSIQVSNVDDDEHHDSQEEGDPMLAEIFCRIIPNLNRTCDAIRTNQVELLDVGRNERFDKSNYDLLAVHARKVGRFPLGEFRMSRPHAWDVVQDYQEVVLNRTSLEFPLECMPAKNLQAFRNLSIAVESRFLPGRERSHAAGFDEAVHQNKFCHVDPEKTLQLPEWRSFFKPAVVIGPIVVDRQMSGQWFPSFDPMTQSVLDVFYPNPAGRPLKRSVRHVEFVGFINADGTGMDGLVDAVSKSASVVSNFLYPAIAKEDGGSGSADLNCVFGPKRNKKSSQDSNVTLPVPHDACPKSTYLSLIAHWFNALPRLHGTRRMPTSSLPEPSKVVISPSLRVQALLTPVFMVRKPYDRLWSLWQNQLRASSTASDLALDHSLNDTFASWVEALGSDAHRRKMGRFKDQFRAIAADPRRAISAIAESARVLVMVDECYDLSLQILAERHPKVFDRDVLLRSSSAVTPPRSWSDKNINLDLERSVRKWFDADYQFYDAAVLQFRKLIAVAESLDAEAVRACLEVLSSTERLVGNKSITS